ncbi:poly(A) RNA poly(A)merase cid14-like protein [Senna tora]|uniref:Poly(A) RNA poly(A)merase cid14-like protein n=1 Tax=Senna tora TaxID=362788 RepID=A0A834XGU9_9FABA|nr:poly(A) RNA poly(A)merase cid14-like protein [Senna tora]
MGGHEGWAQPPGGLLPNGLLPNDAASVIQVLDSERWLKAEERTAELITCIQPNPPSEERRNAVADYVQRLIMKCFPGQVFTFGSVPLKTYLPDGDIDLTAFSKNQNLKDTWAHQVRDMLENEEKNEHAEFHVKEVQYIQAEVKIIKCLVENIVVDISFNQLGGLCTLCFLEEVDNLINQNHLFKRSIILIKAWCYYESRILGAHHGLISTYALETLVLYIFHVFNNSFAGPLEVLYRFLECFSKFDWDNFCVSLWGPVPISSLPDVTAEPPRNDGGDLLLSKLFLDACSSVYAVFPGGQETQGQTFISKHFNVIDPLRVNNNLGRSVSKGNSFRIRSAFAFGAKELARLLDCPKEDLFFEVNQFFMNTWDRHGSGKRPDAPSNELWRLRLSSHDQTHGSENLRNNGQKIYGISNNEYEVERTQCSQNGPSHHSCSSNSSDASTRSHTQSLKGHSNQNNFRTSQQVRREISFNQASHVDKGQRNVKSDNPIIDVHGRFIFARTRSSPELTDSYGEFFSQGRRTRAQESGKGQNSTAKLESSCGRNLEPVMVGSHGARIDQSSARLVSPSHVLDATADSNSGSTSYHDESGSGVMGEEFAPIVGAGASQMMLQEEQDILNMMTSSTTILFSDQAHVPLNLAPGHLPLPFPPSLLASMGYAQRNMGNLPSIEATWGTNIHFPQGLVPSPFTPYFPGIGLTSNTDDTAETGNDNFSAVEANSGEADNDFWQEQERGSASGVEVDNGIPDDKKQSTSGCYTFVPSSQVINCDNSSRIQQKFTKENRGITREKHIDTFQYQDSRRNEVCFDDRIANFRLPNAPLSSKSKTSSENSWEGSPAKFSKSTREKRGRKNTASVVSTGYGKGKDISGTSSNLIDDENREWSSLSTTNMSERSTGATGSMHVQRHQVCTFEPIQTSGSDSLIPVTPVHSGPGSRQRAIENSGVVPFAFYPTGPPVPFLTMLPVYNFPTESGTSDTSTSNFNGEEAVDNYDSGHNFDSFEGYDQLEVSGPPNFMRRAPFESSEHKSDILNSDFASHWQNLQYGRFCQNSRHPPSIIYPSPVPPVYLQGRFPLDGPGRPLSTNMNLLNQLINYGPRLVPVAPLQSVLNRPANIYQRFVDEMPRYRSGTGTYLPNPKVSVRDRHSTSTRRGNYNYDRSDHHGDREGNWNMNSKLRSTGRGHNRFQTERPSSKQEQLASIRSSSSLNTSANVAYGMYSLPSMNPSGVSSNGPTIPSVVMLYPYDHNAGYGSPAEHLEFGSFGAMGFSSVNEPSLNEGSRSGGTFEEHRFLGDSVQRSSPDHPSSPHLQGYDIPFWGIDSYARLVVRSDYQLKEEHFPRSACGDQGGKFSGENYSVWIGLSSSVTSSRSTMNLPTSLPGVPRLATIIIMCVAAAEATGFWVTADWHGQ